MLATLPLFLAVALGLVVAERLLVADEAVWLAAHDAARAAATADSPEQAVTAGTAAGLATAGAAHLDPGQLQLAVAVGDFRRGGHVVATATYQLQTGDVPGYGWLHPRLVRANRQPVDLYRALGDVTP